MGVGARYNFTVTFDQYILDSRTEALALTQSYLETIGNPMLAPFDETYTSGSGRTISIAVSCSETYVLVADRNNQRASHLD